MNTGPDMATFGARQARRFLERKGYDRESLHLYRPGPETIGKWVTKMKQQAGPDGVVLVPERKRVTEPFSSWKKNVKPFWDLNLKANARRRELAKRGGMWSQTFCAWMREPKLVRLGCYYERRDAGLT